MRPTIRTIQCWMGVALLLATWGCREPDERMIIDPGEVPPTTEPPETDPPIEPPASCDAAIDLLEVATPMGEGLHHVGTTVGADDHGTGSCAVFTGGPDVVFRYAPEIDGDLVARTDAPGTDYDTVLHVRTACEDEETEVACGDDVLDGEDLLSTSIVRLDDVRAGETYFLFVDGFVDREAGPAAGQFELSVEVIPHLSEGAACDADPLGARCGPGFACGDGTCQAQVCGDGVTLGVEECDDGNAAAGDGCSAACTLEAVAGGGEDCETAAELTLTDFGGIMAARATGDTTESRHDVVPPCDLSSDSGSPDDVFRFTLDAPHDVEIVLEPDGFDALLSLSTGCEPSAMVMDCSDSWSGHTETIVTTLPAGTWFIDVDGYDGETGPYTLTVRAQP